MNSDTDPYVTLKLMVAWAGVLFGSVSLSQLVLLATLVYTLLQIFVLIRKTWFPKAKMNRGEE